MYYVGSIDLSTVKLAVIVTDSDGAVEEVKPYMLSKHNTKRYMDAMKVGYQLAKTYSAKGDFYAFPEKPIFWRGGRSTLPLAQISGALCAGLWAGGAISVIESMNTQWKKDVVGKGTASKPEIAIGLKKVWPSMYQYIARNHTTGVKNPVPDQDLIDSACINIYGQRIAERTKRIKKHGTSRKLILRKKR